MKKVNSTYSILVLLMLVSIAIYAFQLIHFQSPRDTGFYFLQDMAFLPLQVAIVTIVIGKILNYRETKERLKKVNMMLSTFFSEVGHDLLVQLHTLYAMPQELEAYLNVEDTWSKSDFRTVKQEIQKLNLHVNHEPIDLQGLKTLLSEKRYTILLMLQNPNLIEHETFTDLLWATFHLTDELLGRSSLINLPENDLNHLNTDALRAYKAILIHWLDYLEHLQSDYPYLFSLELRKNPFHKNHSIVVA